MDQLDERIRGLADEIHECHLTLVLDMQIEIERLWAGKTKDLLVISFGEGGGKFSGIVGAARRVGHALFELIPDFSLEEVVAVVAEIEDADRRSSEFLSRCLISVYVDLKEPVREFTMGGSDDAYNEPLSREEWFDSLKGIMNGRRQYDYDRTGECDKRAFLAAYADIVRLKIDQIVKRILREECGQERMRTSWPWPFEYFLIDKALTMKNGF